eukprot:TRINITY_DN21146_c0_g1_i2.p1 TRINITY_DN21146_c0_g1~~TRINITY_DN21146_c0_g1_i2.p1  ORF type:complete len:1146 (+),score=210.80 TRINITY_DN21146_c0_g1_i2:272-3709(+)
MSSVAGGSGAVAQDSESRPSPESAILFVGISLLLGMASRQLLNEFGTHHGLGLLGESIRAWSNINPNLILFVFLPALLFESSFAMELHQIKRCLVQMLLLAGPGVVISTFSLGIVIRFLFPYGWDWKLSLLLGGLLSATDPVAVVALLKELGASKKVNTIIEGESLMNDGAAIVVYKLLYHMVLGEGSTVADVIKFLSQITLGAVALGLAFGLVSFLWLGIIFNDTVIEITLTLTVSYVAYFTAEDAVEVSGVLTVMTLGMFYAAVAKTAFKGESQRSLHHFWEMVAYIANTLIFILSGVVIAENILQSQDIVVTDNSWGYLFLLYVFLQVSRLLVVAILYPGLRYFGYGLDWKEATILIWAGLRGAVALSLSLILNRSSYSASIPELTSKTGALFVFLTGGVVFLTLIINGSTTQFVLHFLGLDRTSEAKKRILEFTKYEMENKALEAFQELRDDEELGPADWHSVVKYIKCLKESEGRVQMHPHEASVNEEGSLRMHMQDTRLRFLNGVQAAYWEMLDEGRITQTAAILLMQSVDEAIDLVASHELLLDWKGLEAHVQFPAYFRYLKLRMLPQKLVTFFTVERLELACYICAAFLRAHRIARRHLREFLGESEVAEAVISESEAEGEPAKQFLEDVQLTFPQVLRVVKTKQVTYSILLHLSDYIQNLEKAGLLEEKEMNQLHDSVQTDLKKLLRNPPLVRMPSVAEMLNDHPLIGALPSNIRQPLRSAAKEMLIMRGKPLYKESSKSEGIWLIANGVVQWKSKSIEHRHFLHPTFSHGSTVGLYESLTGRPYLCELTADSVLHCFFIEKENILSALRSTPAIEDFLWKESAMVVAKLVLPDQFEDMSMQEMRALVLEHSTMRCYLRGETIEILPKEIAILLEGYVRQEGSNEQTVSPAGLLYMQPEHRPSNIAEGRRPSMNQQALLFQADTRSRIIIFDFSSHQKESTLISRNSASSLVRPRSLGLQRRASHEHEALLSWPDMHHQNVASAHSDKKEANVSHKLSEKALRLSVFGSSVDFTKYSRTGSLLRLAWTPGSGSADGSKLKSKHIKRFHSSSAIPSATSTSNKAASASASTVRANLRSQSAMRIDRDRPVDLRAEHQRRKLKNRSKEKERGAGDSSEDGSDAEDDHLRRIDSPSHLF